jgi:ATP-dependent Clp protease adaptor protein ClpS
MTTPYPQLTPGTVQRTERSSELAPLYHLVLLDDDEHTYQYVIDLLGHVFGYGREKSFAIACVVDSQGRAIVETAGEDSVLAHQRQIHAFGADPRMPHCQGSMSAIIEKAP